MFSCVVRLAPATSSALREYMPMASMPRRRVRVSKVTEVDHPGHSRVTCSAARLWLQLSELTGDKASTWIAARSAAELASLCSALSGFTSPSRSKLAVHVADSHEWMRRYRSLCEPGKLADYERTFVQRTEDWLGKASVPLTACAASAHLVQEQSGSAVRVAPEHFLTCAHCVCHDDDPDEDDESSAIAINRVGRLKLLVTGRGEWAVAECVYADDAADLALLRVVELSASPAAAAQTADPHFLRPFVPESRAKVVCVGNPSAFDLETDIEGATIEFRPPVFHTSTGRVGGPTAPARRARLGLGPLRHSAWTYWGHSGAPLVDVQGRLVGLHNSWDADKGTRHGVDAAAIQAFLDRAAASVKV